MGGPEEQSSGREAGVSPVHRFDVGAVLGGAQRRRGVRGTPASSTSTNRFETTSTERGEEAPQSRDD